MIKSVTIISIAVTTFVLVFLAGVVYAYQSFNSPASTPTPDLQSSVQTASLDLVTPSPAVVSDISPQDAASTALKFSNRTDLYSVELADFNGSQTYKVTFSSGDVIYVSLNGQVVGSALPTQPIVSAPTTQPAPAIVYSGPIKKHASAGGGGNNNSSGGGGGGGEHDGGGD